MPRPDPLRRFNHHVCAVCAIAVVALALDAAHPGDPTAAGAARRRSDDPLDRDVPQGGTRNE